MDFLRSGLEIFFGDENIDAFNSVVSRDAFGVTRPDIAVGPTRLSEPEIAPFFGWE
jgi:hypothetical protein